MYEILNQLNQINFFVKPIVAQLFTNYFSSFFSYNPTLVRPDILIAVLLKIQILVDVRLHRLVCIYYAMADRIQFYPKKNRYLYTKNNYKV